MQLALQAVNDGMSILRCQKNLGFLISNRRNQRWKTTTPGRPTELSADEETALSDYIKFIATIAQPLTVPGIKAFAWAISKHHTNNNRFFNKETGSGHTWWDSFKKRHKDEITLRKPNKLDRGRSRMANQTVMDQHFDLLKKTLEELDILDQPERIYNCDESGMAMDKMMSKVIVQRRSKQAYSKSKGNR